MLKSPETLAPVGLSRMPSTPPTLTDSLVLFVTSKSRFER